LTVVASTGESPEMKGQGLVELLRLSLHFISCFTLSFWRLLLMSEVWWLRLSREQCVRGSNALARPTCFSLRVPIFDTGPRQSILYKDKATLPSEKRPRYKFFRIVVFLSSSRSSRKIPCSHFEFSLQSLVSIHLLRSESHPRRRFSFPPGGA
jgi:hypothetical protein